MKAEKIWAGAGKDEFTLHHAYLIIGEREKAVADTMLFLGQVGHFDIRSNPDFYLERFDNFSVDDARRIKSLAEKKAVGEMRVFIITWNFATQEAENSLLKVLEEPSERTHFFIIVPPAAAVLPTLRSRLTVIDDTKDSKGAAGEARNFLNSSHAERLKEVKGIVERVKEDEESRRIAADFVSQLETELWRTGRKSGEVGARAFDEIAVAKKYIRDRSASIKLILEHLSVVLPVMDF